MLKAYIESNVAFMAAHRSHVVALVEIFTHARRRAGRPVVDPHKHEAGLMELAQILRRGQRSGEFRSFSTQVMAVSIRAAIDAITLRMLTEPRLELDAYGRELAALFRQATRAN